jgi:hypothetical protein
MLNVYLGEYINLARELRKIRSTMKKITNAPKSTEDRWAAQRAQLEAAAAEQAAADIAFVEAKRQLERSQEIATLAASRKTTAEKKLATLRANLGGE